MSWYSAHIIMYVEFKNREIEQAHFPVWENIVLIEAQTEAGAIQKAEELGCSEQKDEDESFEWGGKPARWVFAGIRKVTECQSFGERPGDGTELTYIEMELGSLKAVEKLAGGKELTVRYRDRIRLTPEVAEKEADETGQAKAHRA